MFFQWLFSASQLIIRIK